MRIPAKSWPETAHVYTTVERASEFGVVAAPPGLDWAAALRRKNQVVDGLVKGLSGLLSARNVDVREGFGRLSPGGVEVKAPDGGIEELSTRTVIGRPPC